MNQIKRLASQTPLTFGLAVTIAFMLLVVITAVLANRWPAETRSWHLASTAGRVISTVLLLALVVRLDWLRAAGLTRIGTKQVWLLVLVALAYLAAASTYAMSGHLNFSFLGQPLPGAAALFIFMHALFEEVTFRGLVLVALINAGTGTARERVQSAVVSSLLFAGMHILNVAGGNPLPVVLLQATGAFFLGIVLAALVLRARSIYPAVAVHSMANLVGYLVFEANPSAASSSAGWLLQSALLVPLAGCALYLLGNLRRRAAVPVVANG